MGFYSLPQDPRTSQSHVTSATSTSNYDDVTDPWILAENGMANKFHPSPLGLTFTPSVPFDWSPCRSPSGCVTFDKNHTNKSLQCWYKNTAMKNIENSRWLWITKAKGKPRFLRHSKIMRKFRDVGITLFC